jgi:tetratricopeptide (TPR) repeat protein
MENRLPLRISLGLILAVMAAYLPVVNCDFVNYDDGGYVYNNPHVKTGLTRENVVWAWTKFHAANWHPLTWMSHQLDCQLFGLKPRQHHLVNLVWHIANTVGLFLVLRRMTGEDWRPALVAALFGLHPLHVESVAWVAERKDVLSTFFAILTLGMYTLYAARPSAGRYLAVLAAFVIGLLCKPMLVTWPFVLLLMDYWPLRRCPISPADERAVAPRFAPAGWRRLIWEKVPLLVLALASSIVTMQAQKGAMKASQHLALSYRLGNAVVSYAAYLRKMIWPMDLAAFYQHQGTRLPLASVVVSAVVLLLLTLLVLAGFRRRPALLVGWLWYLGTLVPVIGLVQVGIQSMADRYTYIPLIGIFLALAWSIPPVPQSRPITRSALGLTAGAIVLVCLTLTFRQTNFWRSDDLLWTRALAVAENPLTHCTYGGVLYTRAGELSTEAGDLQRKGRTAEAEQRVAEAKGCIAEAERQCRIALQKEPGLQLASARLAEYRASRGDLEGALAPLQEGIALAPQSAGLHNRLGRVLAYQGRIEEACQQFREACRLDPEQGIMHLDLATALGECGDHEEAEREAEIGRRLQPDLAGDMRDYARRFYNRSDVRFDCPAAAVFHAQEACWASPRPQAKLYQTLAEAHAAAGQPIAAYAAVQRALALAESNGPADLVPNLREQVRSYQTTARQREATQAACALAAPAVSTLSASMLTLSTLTVVQSEHHSLPGRTR